MIKINSQKYMLRDFRELDRFFFVFNHLISQNTEKQMVNDTVCQTSSLLQRNTFTHGSEITEMYPFGENTSKKIPYVSM